MSGLISAGADLGSTLITDVIYAFAVFGAIIAILGTAFALVFAAEYRKIRRQRRQPAPELPAEWAQAVTTVVADLGLCPWCDDRACIDSTLCDCTGPCGRRYCKAPEMETVQ